LADSLEFPFKFPFSFSGKVMLSSSVLFSLAGFTTKNAACERIYRHSVWQRPPIEPSAITRYLDPRCTFSTDPFKSGAVIFIPWRRTCKSHMSNWGNKCDEIQPQNCLADKESVHRHLAPLSGAEHDPVATNSLPPLSGWLVQRR